MASTHCSLGNGPGATDSAQLSARGWIFLVLILQGLRHQSRGQVAARPSLTGMLIWALSRGALWPSRSTSTYRGSAHGSGGRSLFLPAPCKHKPGLVTLAPVTRALSEGLGRLQIPRI